VGVHQAVGINTTPEPLYHFLQKQKKAIPVLGIGKDITAAIAA